MIDVGANLTDSQFTPDLEAVLDRASKANLKSILVTGTSVPGSQDAYALASKYSSLLYSTAGVHPHDAKNCDTSTIEDLKHLLNMKKVVAVGECGLDYDRNYSPPEIQRLWFEQQLSLADAVNKPVFIHERSAFKDVHQMLRQHPNVRALIHCFTGTQDELDAYLQAGYSIGITGWVCDDKRGSTLQSIVKRIPLDRLMIETDAPYLKPKKAPGKSRNEPCHLKFVAEKLSQCMDVPVEEVITATHDNAKAFFRLS